MPGNELLGSRLATVLDAEIAQIESHLARVVVVDGFDRPAQSGRGMM